MPGTYDEISRSLGELDEGAFVAALDAVVDAGPSPEVAEEVVRACATGMERVGDLFEEGEYFVGDLVYAADILEEGFAKLRPFLSGDGGAKLGSMVLGSAPGDLHDIGKNIFKSMVEAAGFEVHDLGVDVAPEVFVDKVRELAPDIVGISGLLTLSLDSMGEVVRALEEAGVRSAVKVMIGGNPVSEAVRARVGADYFSTNASTAVKQCKAWAAAS